MAIPALPSPARPLAALLAVALLVAACQPGAASTPAATSAARPSTPEPPAAAVVPTPGETRAETQPATAPPTASPTTASPTPTLPPDAEVEREPEPYEIDLATADDFVRQYTFEWCVGASLQMALNMATDEQRDSRRDQQALWEMARDRSFSPFGGANPRGWTQALNDLGIGPYRLVSLPTLDEAITVAAQAIRATERPVGLVMWRGRHAWVMSGLESTADPGHFDAFDVTGIRVHDPLYPHGSSAWGPSPKPGSLVSPETLGEQFVLRDSNRVNLGVPAGYLLVLPVASEA